LWSWSYGSWIYDYLCNQCLSPLILWVWILVRRGVFYTTLWDKVCQWLVTCLWFSLGTLVSSINKADQHDITEILLKVALSTITSNPRSRCQWINIMQLLHLNEINMRFYEAEYNNIELKFFLYFFFQYYYLNIKILKFYENLNFIHWFCTRVQYVFFIAQKLLFANQYVRKWNVTYIASGQ
jgi:hypothetical protein